MIAEKGKIEKNPGEEAVQDVIDQLLRLQDKIKSDQANIQDYEMLEDIFKVILGGKPVVQTYGFTSWSNFIDERKNENSVQVARLQGGVLGMLSAILDYLKNIRKPVAGA